MTTHLQGQPGRRTERTPPYTWALLLDGRVVGIRSLTAGDLDTVERLHASMSTDNQRMRFLGWSSQAAHQISLRICAPSDARHDALGAWRDGELIGVTQYERADDDSGDAEIAFAVADVAHHLGVATLLLEHLAARAREAGVRRFTGEVFTSNSAMLRVFADAGLATSRIPHGETVTVVAALDVGEPFLDAMDERERRTQVASLRPMFSPESIVVIGASDRPGSVGGAVVRNLVAAGFAGPLAVSHPRRSEVAGVACVPNLSALPFRADLAVVAVHQSALRVVAEECGRHGVRGLVMLTAGVDQDTGRAVRDACRRYGMRLVGPNCVGIANPSQRLNASFTAHPIPAGSAGVAVQSGGVGIVIAEQLARLGIGVSTLVSLGDKYDVSATDLLHYWYDDHRTELALLYIESFGNPRKFARVARRLAARIPVIAVDSGRSAPAKRAAVSHTAAAATPTATRQALFADAGIIAVPDLGDLTSAAALVSAQPLPAGPKVAVLSNAGGAGILTADACADAGLTLPPLAESTVTALDTLLPTGASIANPVDAAAVCDARTLAAAAAVIAGDPGIDAVLVLPVPTAIDDMTDVPWPDAPVPLLGIRMEQGNRVAMEKQGRGRSLPVYATPHDAAAALGRAAAYSAWRSQPASSVPVPDGLDLAQARALTRTYLAENPDGGWLDPAAACAFVSTTGVTPVPVRLATSAAGAAAAARDLGLPVALKAYGPSLAHKQHSHGVALRLTTMDAARAAYADLAGRLGDAMTGVVVQPMRGGDLELLVGISSDPVFGPVVAYGLGGTEADALADRVVRLAPLTERAADEMVRGFRAAAVLDRAASGGPVAVAAIRDLLVRVALLAHHVPEIAGIDLNPVLAAAEGIELVDVKVRLQPHRVYDPFLRRLR